MAAFEQQDQKSPAIGGIVFTGSSSIRLWDLARSFQNLPVLNRGFGGSPIIDSVTTSMLVISTGRHSLFYAGDNDLAAGKTPQQVTNDFKAFVAKIRAALPDRASLHRVEPSILRWSIAQVRRPTPSFGVCNGDDRLQLSRLDGPMLRLGRQAAQGFPIQDGLHSRRRLRLWATLVRPFSSRPRGLRRQPG